MILRPTHVLSHVLFLAVFAIAGCSEADRADGAPPIRGLITTTVSAAEETTRRRFPGVLEPTDITSLSFEVAGKLGEVELSVGQRVAAGEVLARLDSAQFEVEIENRAAAVEEAEAVLAQDTDDLERQERLLQSGTVTVVSVDEARTQFLTSRAQLTQAERSLQSAREDLADSVIVAPFDGIINSVEADSFATVAVGAVVTSIYDATTYEVSFSVNFETVSQLVVGTPAMVRLADDPNVALAAVVSELGERADTVSSFPVVVELRETHPLIRAGMAVEVSLEFRLPSAEGFLIPITAAINEGQIPEETGPRAPSNLEVYVFDPETSTVRRREIVMAGIRDNRLLVIDGLSPGERVAVAGVSFLREGMQVNLLEARE